MLETGVGVLDKVMSILYLFIGKKHIQTVQEIIDKLGYPAPTVYRLINAMAKHGLLKREGDMISLGSTIMTLGVQMIGNIDICNEAMPYMERLNRLTDENVNLNIRSQSQRVVIQTVQSKMTVRPTINIGDMYPVFSGAAGKIFMAYSSSDEWRKLLYSWDENASREINQENFDQYYDSIERFREAGYAVSINERKEGIVAIAAPIFDYTNNLKAVLTLIAPESRMDEERRRITIPKVVKCASMISTNMGYTKKMDVENVLSYLQDSCIIEKTPTN